MRIGSHIALQITILVITGVAVSVQVLTTARAALDGREMIEGDVRELERFERVSDLTSHLVLIGDMVLSGGTTYLIAVAETHAAELEAVLIEMDASPLFLDAGVHGHALAADVHRLRETIAAASHHNGEQRETVLEELYSHFDELSVELSGKLDRYHTAIHAAAGQREATTRTQTQRAQSMSWIAAFGFLTVLLITWQYLSRAIRRPIVRLAERAIQATESGTFEPPDGGPSEVRELSVRFATLVDGLQSALHARAAFLANTSHELRTPLNAILGYADLIADSRTTVQEQKEGIENIRDSGRHLLALIEEVLDLSKIDADQMTLERIDVSPRTLLRDVEVMLMGTAKQKGVKLTVTVDASVPGTIRSDPIRLRQILVNVAGNALKYTAVGSVRVGAKYDRGNFVVDVQDTGVGIPPDKIDTIFEEFRQADVSSTRRYGGTGLGLSISRRLARLMEGDLNVHSEVGVGSTFCIQVPAEAVVTRSLPTSERDIRGPLPSVVAERQLRILLVDDVPTNRRLGRRVLERSGFLVVDACDGREAVEVEAAARARDECFDLILMDMQMPVMNGYESTRAIKAAGFVGPILALSAAVLAEQQVAAREAGCIGFVTKPFQAAALEQTILKLCGSIQADTTVS